MENIVSSINAVLATDAEDCARVCAEVLNSYACIKNDPHPLKMIAHGVEGEAF